MKAKPNLWLTKTRYGGYELWNKDPSFDEFFRRYQREGFRIRRFCRAEWERFCPQMKLKMNEKRRLVATKRGISLARKKK